MSQIYKAATGGGGGVVDSVTGTLPIVVDPTTGDVVVSVNNATTSTTGIASFNPTDFTVSGAGEVSLASTGGSPLTGVNVQTFTSSGTYTPTAAMTSCIIEVVGGGGGSAYNDLEGGAFGFISSGAGGAGYAKGLFSASTIGASQAVTVGDGGTAGTSSAGATSGTTSSVGVLISATGGSFSGIFEAGPGGAGSGGFLNIPGSTGGIGYEFATTDTFLLIGCGGASALSTETRPVYTNTGSNVAAAPGNDYGGGASGNFVASSGAASNGAAGAPGIVIITEYIS